MQAISTFFPTQPTSIDEALEQYTNVRAALLHDLQTQYFTEPLEGRWSVNDILWHLHLVERGSGSALRRMLEGERGERISDEVLSKIWGKMNKVLLNRADFKLPAPDAFAPEGKTPQSPEECVVALGQSRDKVLSHVQGVSTEELLRVQFPHLVLGMLPGLFWISFIAMHEARHLEQMRELIVPVNP